MSEFDQKATTWDQDQNRVNIAQAVAKGIKESVSLAHDTKALDFGCGTGLLSFFLHPYLKEITLADNSDGMLSTLKQKIVASQAKNMRALKFDFETDPPLQEKFNLIYSSMVLHHVQNISKLFGVLFNLLEPAGQICIADLVQEDGSFHGPEFIGHKGFERASLMKIVRQAGFSNIVFQDIHTVIRPKSPGQSNSPIFLMKAQKGS